MENNANEGLACQDAEVERKHREAVEQVRRYADSDTVKSGVKTTTLHRIVVLYRGVDMVVCEEV